MNKQNTKKQNGFTLIEVMITLVVAGIIANFALPAMGSMLARHRIEAAAVNLQTQLQLVRSHAIKVGHTTWVSFDTQAQSWQYGVADNDPCDPTKQDSCTVAGVAKVFSGDQWNGVKLSQSFDNNAVGFNPRRGMATHAGTITLASAAGKVAVNVSRLGLVTVCTQSGGITNFPACG